MSSESKKKILYIITKSVWAGAGKYTHDLAVSLSQTEFKPMVAAGGRGVMAKKLIAAGIPYFEIRSFRRDVCLYKDILAFFEILSILFKTKPDIIHVSSAKAGGIAGAAAFVYKAAKKSIRPFRRISHYARSQETALLISRPRTIFTAHGWAFSEARPKWQIVLIKFFSKITCLFYDKVICVSEYDREIALKNKIAAPEKLTAIHNGIKPEEYDFLPREKARDALKSRLDIQCPGDVWVGSIGEFTRNKGHRFLINVIKNQFSISNFQFLIIGFGEEKSNLKNQISSLGLEDKVLLVDNMPDAARYLKAFDIFILPSLKEGFPYTLLEAGLAETPTVAANVGGIPEIIEDGTSGILIHPANADELAVAIEKMAGNPELRNTLARNAREKILREFSFEKMIAETIRLYE